MHAGEGERENGSTRLAWEKEVEEYEWSMIWSGVNDGVNEDQMNFRDLEIGKDMPNTAVNEKNVEREPRKRNQVSDPLNRFHPSKKIGIGNVVNQVRHKNSRDSTLVDRERTVEMCVDKG